MTGLLYVASRSIDAGKLWVNPDCGLKTRKWEEVKPAIENMVIATEILRKSI
jgi:5-methyltetrahydropteroyltriglutamate--homocysteine methyltransferase